MFRQFARGRLAHLRNAERVQKTRERRVLAAIDLREQLLRRFFAELARCFRR